ncbi:MAG: DUF1820 family protein [Gammaproteobacteria bacterium]|nr:DUF1820 family protein [Gammaproteobacteria bacterium]
MAKGKRPAARIYKIQFQSQGERYELYAREVSQSNMYAFIEVAGILFGERSKWVVDPSEERLKAEFGQVNRTYIPLHSVVRIDEVEKEGVGKIIDKPAAGKSDDKIAPFPMPPPQPQPKRD